MTAIIKPFSFIFLLTFCIRCNKSTDEGSAIRKVIEAEDITFYQNKDRLAHASFWHIIPETRWWYSGLSNTEFWTGADYKAAIAKMDIPPADNATCTFTDFFVKVNGTIGWATYDKKNVTPEGKTEFAHEFRGMEKINGEWKIISASVHAFTPK